MFSPCWQGFPCIGVLPLLRNIKCGADTPVSLTLVISLVPVLNEMEPFQGPPPPTCQRPGHIFPPGPLCWVLTLGVPITQGGCPHVTQPDCPLAAAVYKGVAVMGVELGCRDHLCELLHVGWLDVHDIWHRRVKEGQGEVGRAWAMSGPCREHYGGIYRI